MMGSINLTKDIDGFYFDAKLHIKETISHLSEDNPLTFGESARLGISRASG